MTCITSWAYCQLRDYVSTHRSVRTTFVLAATAFLLGCSSNSSQTSLSRVPLSEEGVDAVLCMPPYAERFWVSGRGAGYLAELLRLAAVTDNPVARRALIGELLRSCQGDDCAIGTFVLEAKLDALVAHIPGSEIWLEQARAEEAEMLEIAAYALLLLGSDHALQCASYYYAAQLRHPDYRFSDFMRYPEGYRYGGGLLVEIGPEFRDRVLGHPAFMEYQEEKVGLRLNYARANLVEAGVNAVPALLGLLSDTDYLVRLQAKSLLEHISGLSIYVNTDCRLNVDTMELRDRLKALGRYPQEAHY